MVVTLIGAGGWSYFNIQGDKLREYSRAFRTVEVNSTYYTVPPISRVEGWRNRVSDDFEFTVRCNRELAKKLELAQLGQSREVYYRMKEICKTLQANVLHIETSSTFKLDHEVIKKIDAFLSNVGTSYPRLAWEIRSPHSPSRENLLRTLREHNVIHSVDLSKETPAYENDIIYSRLFGKGKHNIYQFTNQELKEIDQKAKESKASKVYLNFHGTRMYKDAARISVYEATGKFPKVTSGVGVDSVVEVLAEDSEFPSTTSGLINSQGWKVCEWKDNQQLHLSEILSRIEEKKFDNIHQLELELQRL